MSLADIRAERASWGDPTEIFDTEVAPASGVGTLWIYKYANGKWEYVNSRDVWQCSLNAGGDIASGCDTILNPHANRDVCETHDTTDREEI